MNEFNSVYKLRKKFNKIVYEWDLKMIPVDLK